MFSKNLSLIFVQIRIIVLKDFSGELIMKIVSPFVTKLIEI